MCNIQYGQAQTSLSELLVVAVIAALYQSCYLLVLLLGVPQKPFEEQPCELGFNEIKIAWRRHSEIRQTNSSLTDGGLAPRLRMLDSVSCSLIAMSGICLGHVSSKSPSNISPNH